MHKKLIHKTTVEVGQSLLGDFLSICMWSEQQDHSYDSIYCRRD